MRVFLAAFAHETNSFSPLPTTLRSFEQDILYLPGDTAAYEKARQFAGYADLLAVARRHGDDVVAGMCAWAQPSGLISRGVYEQLRDALLADIRAAGPVDMVLLVLHGAMMADGYADCEGDLLQRVRAQAGPAMPVGALLDLHGNVTPAMIGSGAVLVACKEYPHTDYAERSAELYAILASAVQGAAVSTVMRRVPMLGLFGTTEGPMRDFVGRLKQAETTPGIHSVSAMHGFPWSDSPHTGAAIVVVHDSARGAAADELAACLAAEMLELRDTGARRLPLNEALDLALGSGSGGKPVVLADGADNPGGGAACDSTFVLQALLARGVSNAALGMIWDPQAVAIATDAGTGARISLRVGGKVGPQSGSPVDLDAEVLCVRADARQPGLGGKGSDALGNAVAIRAAGIDIVLNTVRQQVFSPECFTELGIDVASKSLVVVKSTQHFRAGFDPVAGATVYCDTPGTLSARIDEIPYRRIARPIWPLDPLSALPTDEGFP
jgi:microcystin degradation protein MlrC